MKYRSYSNKHHCSSRILRALIESSVFSSHLHADLEIQAPAILEFARLEQCQPAIEKIFEEIAHEEIKRYIARGRRRHPALADENSVVRHIQFHEIHGT